MSAYCFVTDRSEIRSAFNTLSERLNRAATRTLRRLVGFQGGNREEDVCFIEEEGYWYLLREPSSVNAKNRYWCAFGTNEPDERMLSIVCEINPPLEGVNRRIAGAFIRDSDGVVSLAHSGKIGGGRKGIGKRAFLQEYRGPSVIVERHQGDHATMLVVSSLTDHNLSHNIGEFVRKVDDFKCSLAQRSHALPHENQTATFRPEFSGSYTSTVHLNRIVKRQHGRIIDALERELTKRRYRVANDQQRDLIVAGRGKSIKMLFEAKTGAGSQDIYTGVGQLFINGALKPKPKRRVLVLPREPNRSTQDVLKELRIDVLIFTDDGERVRFRNLGAILA